MFRGFVRFEGRCIPVPGITRGRIIPALPGFFGDNMTPNDGSANTVESVATAIIIASGVPDFGAIFQNLLDTSNVLQDSSNLSFSTGFFVVLLESSKTLTNFGELAFFRTPTEVPVNERALIRRT